jgi:hypothetical protein
MNILLWNKHFRGWLQRSGEVVQVPRRGNLTLIATSKGPMKSATTHQISHVSYDVSRESR